jgi:hypothetical protein
VAHRHVQDVPAAKARTSITAKSPRKRLIQLKYFAQSPEWRNEKFSSCDTALQGCFISLMQQIGGAFDLARAHPTVRTARLKCRMAPARPNRNCPLPLGVAEECGCWVSADHQLPQDKIVDAFPAGLLVETVKSQRRYMVGI